MLGERSRRELSLGSGVIVSADGYILTNNHVVGQQGRGAQVTVVLADKREVRGAGRRHRRLDRHRAAQGRTSPGCR